jgi:hypothetical protein
MITYTTLKAVEATNFNGPHTDTNSVNSPTDGASNQAHECMAVLAPSIPPSPDKVAILAALMMPIAPAYAFGLRAPAAKPRKRIHSIHEMVLGNFLVSTGDKQVYCADLEAVQAFAKKLGVTK